MQADSPRSLMRSGGKMATLHCGTKNREGLKQWPLTPGVAVDFSKLGIAPAVGSPEWRKRTPVCTERFAQEVSCPKP